MSIALDATSSGSSGASPSSLTVSHVCTGSDRYLLVFVSSDSGTNLVISSVTYNGVALTQLIGNVRNGNVETNCWYLANPDSGTHDVVVNFSTSADSILVQNVSYTGCKNQAPEASNSNSIVYPTSAPMVVNVTTLSANALVVGGGAGNRDDQHVVMSGTGENERIQQTAQGHASAIADEATTTTGSYGMEFNQLFFNNLCGIVLSLEEAGGAPPAVNDNAMLAMNF